MCTLISTYISTGVDSDARVQKQSQPHLARPTSIADICPLNTGAYTTVVVYLKMTNSQRLVVLFSLLVIAVCFLNSQRLIVCVCFLPIHSGRQVRWTYQPGSHRRKVTHCYIHSSVAVHYLKTELTYLSSQSPGVSIHHSTIIARVISLLLVLYYRAGRPGSSEVSRNPLTRWDVSSIPANGIFLKLKNKNKNAQRVKNDQIVSTQNSTSRSTRERNG